MVAPELERVARDAGGRFLVVKVNTDQGDGHRRALPYRSIPTLAIVFQGRELDRAAGVRPAGETPPSRSTQSQSISAAP